MKTKLSFSFIISLLIAISICLPLSFQAQNSLIGSAHALEPFWNQGIKTVVDSQGNTYVTGSLQTAPLGYVFDFLTIKFDPAGNQVWSKQFNGSGNGNDISNDIALDGLGNVYVTGQATLKDGIVAFATIKYDNNGNQLWVRYYNGAPKGDDIAYALAVDAAGNVHVTGKSGSNTSADYATVKYDANGKQLWVQRYNGPAKQNDAAYAIALDGAGNAYVTGESKGKASPSLNLWNDYATIKYSKTGNQLWARRYSNAAVVNGRDVAKGIAVDSSGNVIVTGYSRGSGSFNDFSTVKYSANGNPLWVRRFLARYMNSPNMAVDLAVDQDGNVLVAGDFSNHEIATVKYSPAGSRLWDRLVVEPPPEKERITAFKDIAVDAAKNVIVVGGLAGGSGIIKYDPTGVQIFANTDGSSWRNSAVAIDSNGDIHATGGSTDISQLFFTGKYDGIDGARIWGATFTAP